MFGSKNKHSIALATLLLLSLSCSLVGGLSSPQSTQEMDPTAVAQTMDAQIDQILLPTQQALLPKGTFSVPQYETSTPEPSLTPIPPTISVTVDADCRYGPGTNYPTVGTLRAGQKVLLHGKNMTNDWWLIDNPGRPGEFCWVGGQNAQFEGDQVAIAVVALPSVYFTAEYYTHQDCEGEEEVETYIFIVRNTGSTTLESGTMTLGRIDNGISLMNSSFPFANSNAPFRDENCGPGRDSLAPGAQALIRIVSQTPDLLTPAHATIRLCAKDGLKGNCLEQAVDFIVGCAEGETC